MLWVYSGDELYGYMTLAKDWKDGVLSIIMRGMSKNFSDQVSLLLPSFSPVKTKCFTLTLALYSLLYTKLWHAYFRGCRIDLTDHPCESMSSFLSGTVQSLL